MSSIETPSQDGPDFNTEDNLHPDTVAERYDAERCQRCDRSAELQIECTDERCILEQERKSND